MRWLVAGGAFHWHGHLWILDIDASGVRWKTFKLKTFIKNVRLTHNSTPDVRRGRGCVIKVDWGMLRELRV